MRGMDDTPAGDVTSTALPPAPGADRYRSLDFADTAATLPASQSYDLLAAPESAMRWLAAHDLTTPDVQLYEVCAQRMRTLRAHIRALFAARVDTTTPPEESLRAVNEALTAVPTAPPRLGRSPGCAASRRTPPTGPSITHWRPSPPTPPTCSPVPTPTSSLPADQPPVTGSSCAPTVGATGAPHAAATVPAPPAPTPGAAAPRADAPLPGPSCGPPGGHAKHLQQAASGRQPTAGHLITEDHYFDSAAARAASPSSRSSPT